MTLLDDVITNDEDREHDFLELRIEMRRRNPGWTQEIIDSALRSTWRSSITWAHWLRDTETDVALATDTTNQ